MTTWGEKIMFIIYFFIFKFVNCILFINGNGRDLAIWESEGRYRLIGTDSSSCKLMVMSTSKRNNVVTCDLNTCQRVVVHTARKRQLFIKDCAQFVNRSIYIDQVLDVSHADDGDLQLVATTRTNLSAQHEIFSWASGDFFHSYTQDPIRIGGIISIPSRSRFISYIYSSQFILQYTFSMRWALRNLYRPRVCKLDRKNKQITVEMTHSPFIDIRGECLLRFRLAGSESRIRKMISPNTTYHYNQPIKKVSVKCKAGGRGVFSDAIACQ